jgi:hypothetical protein
MTMPSQLEISYSITDAEWERTARAFESGGYPTIDCFYGSVQITDGRQRVFEDPYEMSVADLACGLAECLASPPSPSATFREQGGEMELTMAFSEHTVCIQSNTQRKDQVCVIARSFRTGVIDFLRRLAADTARHDIDLRWRDLVVIEQILAAA